MIYTDPCSGRPLMTPRVGRVVAVGRGYGQASVGRAIATSIDEGVETDYDEDSESLREASGQVPASGPAPGPDGNTGCLTRADIYGCFGKVALPSQSSSCASASFDSNIELDVISNVSSSPSGSITASNISTETAEAAEAQECLGEGNEEDTQTDEQKDQNPVSDFREGRRASDGLMVRGVLEFQQHLKKSMKTRGVAELRKELEKLQLEASGDSEAKYRTRNGRYIDVRSLQQRSLEESGTNVRGPNMVIKRTSLPFVGYCTLALQKRLALRHGMQTGPPCYPEATQSSPFAQDPDIRGSPGVASHLHNLKPIKPQPVHLFPYCTSPNRQMWLLQNSIKPAAALHQMQPTQLQQQQQEHLDDSSSARFGQLPSQFPAGKDGHAAAAAAAQSLAYHHFRSLSPSFPYSEASGYRAGPSSELFQMSSSRPVRDNHYVPTCRSQDNLLEYSSNVDVLQGKDSTSLGALLKHPAYCSALPSMASTENPPSELADTATMRRHMVRRTLFRLVQQETLVSPCGEDEPEPGSEPSNPEAEHMESTKTDPSTSMDVS